MAEDLADEVRVAVGLPVEGVGKLETRLPEVVTGCRLDVGDDAAVVEPGQVDLAHPALPSERYQGGGERVGLREIRAAVRADDEHPIGTVAGHDVAEQLHARLVGPVEVVQHEHERLVFRDLLQHGQHRAKEQVTLRVGIGALRGRELPQALAERGHHPSQLRPVALHVRGEGLLRRGLHVVVEGLHKRTVRNGQVLVAAAEQDAGTGVKGHTRRVCGERGLPHARVPGDQDDLSTVPRGHPFEGVGEHVGFGLTADQPHRGSDRQAGGQGDGCRRGVVLDHRFPADLQDLERLGQSLQLDLAQGAERVADAAPRHHPHELGGEDLAALGLGAQARRLDDRVPKVVVALPGGLPRAQSHAQVGDGAALSVASVDAPLHVHCTRHRGGAASEHHHDAVAEVLDLRAARRCDRPAQLGEERPAL